MLCLKGLIVVDAFQAWCGPCKAVVDLFRKIRNEIGSHLLHFAVAEVDSIDGLEEYRGRCEPVFLFYAVKQLCRGGGHGTQYLMSCAAAVVSRAQRATLEHLLTDFAFHTFQGGELVAVVRGVNAPVLQRTILEQLTLERMGLEHGGQRGVVISH
uniref:Thioredoxin domain-containing protein n=1 Tax=Athene cunicularia TaxID=194338 RepID=A0A663LYF5_ATHCN